MKRLDNIRFHNKIGDGAYSTVHKISCNNEFYALKKIPISEEFNPLEFYIMTSFPDCHLMQAIDIYIGRNHFNIVQPLACMDLGVWIKEYHNENIVDLWLLQLLFAVRQLHSSKIIHGDIKPENIVIQGENIYLTDFSLSMKELPMGNNKIIATVTYRPLEVFNYDPSTSKVDIWSLACTMYRMKKREYLFPVQKNDSGYITCLLKWCKENNVKCPEYTMYTMSKDEKEVNNYKKLNLSDPFDKLIFTMLAERPSITKILSNEYFADKLSKICLPRLIDNIYDTYNYGNSVSHHCKYMYDRCKKYSCEKYSLSEINAACLIIAVRCWNGYIKYDSYTNNKEKMYRTIFSLLYHMRYKIF